MIPTHPNPPPPAARPEIVLFHSALGLRRAVREWAERLRAQGYLVHTPDLFGGVVFDEMADGVRHIDEIGGIPELVSRSQAAVEGMPGDLVYAGFSIGAASAELLAATRQGARGAILMHGALPVEAFGASEWPGTVPVQVHAMVGDPFRRQPEFDAFAAAVRRSGAPLAWYDYPGEAHLFADREFADYDASAAEQMVARVIAGLRWMSSTDAEQPATR